MTRNPIDYSKSVFYKIVCRDLTITDLYVGSTTDFKSRKSHHKGACQNEKGKNYHLKVYQFIREHGNFENWDVIVIHRQSCIDSHEAHTIERHYAETLGATLNCNIPSRTEQEWRESNKDKMKEYFLLYNEINKDKRQAYRETHRDEAKECNKSYYESHKEYFKQKYQKLKLRKQQESLAELTNFFI